MYRTTLQLLTFKTSQNMLALAIKYHGPRISYTTKNGIRIVEHFDDSETHYFPDGTVIEKLPEKKQLIDIDDKNILKIKK